MGTVGVKELKNRLTQYLRRTNQAKKTLSLSEVPDSANPAD
jgi:hypothetical protein